MKADELSSSTKQKSKKETREQKTDKEKLETLYKKVENSAFTGQKPTSQSLIEEAEELGLNVESHEGTMWAALLMITRFIKFDKTCKIFPQLACLVKSSS